MTRDNPVMTPFGDSGSHDGTETKEISSYNEGVNTMNRLQTHWMTEELLHEDSIQFSDKSIVIMQNTWIEENGIRKDLVMPVCETSIEGIEKYNNDIWVEIQLCDGRIETPKGDIVRFGYGSMGNEGFVALTTKSNELIWAFFCTVSNPFLKAEIKNNEIQATSELDYVYVISLEDPVNIKVIGNVF